MSKTEPISQQEELEQGQRKVRTGIVTSNKMQKTIVVQVGQKVSHDQYHRVIPHRRSFKAHDEKNEAGIGDWVKIAETRPLSKDKRWRLVEILKRASSAPPVPETKVDMSHQKPQGRKEEAPEA